MLRELFDIKINSENTEYIWPSGFCNLIPAVYSVALFKEYYLSTTCQQFGEIKVENKRRN